MLKILNKISGDDNLSFLSKGIVISFGSQGLAFVLSTFLHIFIARTAGPENYGIYAYAVSWTLLFAMMSKFGFVPSVLRFVASYEANGKWGLLKGIIIKSHQISFALNIVFGSISFIILLIVRKEIGVSISNVLLVSILLGTGMTHLQIIASSLLSLRKVFLSKLVTPVLRPLILFIFAGGFLFLRGDKITGLEIITFDVITHFILILIGAVFLYRNVPVMVRSVKAEFATKVWIKVTFPLFLLSALHLVIAQTDIIMVGSLSGLKDAGIYNAVVKLCFIITFSLISVNSVIAPLISRFYSLGKSDEIKKIFRFTRVLLAMISLPLGAFLFLLSDFCLSVFGDIFINGSTSLKIMVIGKLVTVIAGPIGFLYSMTGHHNSALKVFGISAIMNIALNFIFIRLWGMDGAALASTITIIFWNLTLIFLSKKKFGFSI
ncbi:MAG: oligosaccharide flippase family protein [Candidatus Aminicenantes bacterium]|nr:oligosaccharide flippase family protein [Candidatus Aminicenantes bacterium]